MEQSDTNNIRTAYHEVFLIRRPDADTFADFTETKLAAFIWQGRMIPHFPVETRLGDFAPYNIKKEVAILTTPTSHLTKLNLQT